MYIRFGAVVVVTILASACGGGAKPAPAGLRAFDGSATVNINLDGVESVLAGTCHVGVNTLAVSAEQGPVALKVVVFASGRPQRLRTGSEPAITVTRSGATYLSTDAAVVEIAEDGRSGKVAAGRAASPGQLAAVPLAVQANWQCGT
jgi:hypothetical protein